MRITFVTLSLLLLLSLSSCQGNQNVTVAIVDMDQELQLLEKDIDTIVTSLTGALKEVNAESIASDLEREIAAIEDEEGKAVVADVLSLVEDAELGIAEGEMFYENLATRFRTETSIKITKLRLLLSKIKEYEEAGITAEGFNSLLSEFESLATPNEEEEEEAEPRLLNLLMERYLNTN